MAKKGAKKAKGGKTKGRISRQPRLGQQGGFTVVRRLPTAFISNSSIAGVPQVSNPASASGTNMIVLGSTVAHPIFGATFSVPFAAGFTLDMLAQYTDLTNIADQYKITNVELRFQYNASDIAGQPIGASAPATIPILKYVADYDDASLETVTALQAKQGLKSKALTDGKFHSVRLSPRVADAVYGSSVSTAYAIPAKPMFLDAQSPAIPHYGLKGYFENLPLSSTGLLTTCITVEVAYTVQLKGLQ